ncbi:hypothetical protein TWF694_000306 [Orbilia ellipsospora]|uniref:Uncharacterized protein n=1 Tax=Orbilia ellipsospora TaxID=2528407 RepID=A0AAV9XRK7_9PEZI
MSPIATHHTNTNTVDTRLFPNDFTNIYEIEEERRRKAVLAAEAEKVKLSAEEVEKLRLEREAAMKTEIEKLQRKVLDLEGEKKSLQYNLQQESSRAKRFEEEKATAISQRDTAKTDAAQQGIRANQSDAEVSRLKGEKLEPKNNLDPSYHNKLVMIVNIAGRRAIDMGANNGSEAHCWDFDWNNGNQKLQLIKVDPNDRKSPWKIRCVNSDKYLCARNYQVGQIPGAGAIIEPQRWYHYYIGSEFAGEYV